MRIVSGERRGLRLKAPKGLHTRPTTDRVKESMFNILQNDIRGRTVLDLFAGSGQLGIECLSRGAEHADFCDRDRESIQIIRENIRSAGFEERSGVFAMDSFAFLREIKDRKYDLILLDPPYGGEPLAQALSLIAQFDILYADGIILCESARGDLFPEIPETIRLVRHYHYGNTTVTLLKKQEEDA